MKKIGFIVLLSLFLSAGYAQELNWIKFDWSGHKLGDRYFDKAAIFLPIQLENLPYKFTVQLDLGSSSSILYGNDIFPYMAINEELKNKMDTSSKTWIDSKQYPTFRNLSIKLDNVSFDKINLGFYQGYGDSLTADSVKSKTVRRIGTIGSDFFSSKVLIIDYPNRRICVTDVIPKAYETTCNFIDIKFTDDVIILPVQIGDKNENLMFDTGSSFFALSTNEKNAEEISGVNVPVSDSIKVSSWGKKYYKYGKKVVKKVKIGDAIMPNAIVYYDKREWDYFFVSHNIWGITGNAYFFDKNVIIDFKNQKFGVSNK